MKKILALAATTMFIGMSDSALLASDSIKIKPGQLNVVVFTNQTNLADYSFILERQSPKKEDVGKAEREILTTDETVFKNLYLKNSATDFFTTNKGLRNERDYYSGATNLSRRIKFGEPFSFNEAPTNATMLVIEVVDGAALAGKYTFTAISKSGKLVAEQSILISPEYPELTAVTLEFMKASEMARDSLQKLKEANRVLVEGVLKGLDGRIKEYEEIAKELEKK